MNKQEQKKSNAADLKKIETTISKKVGRACGDYHMIQDGDRILVAVSGGKDSHALLKILSERRSFVPVRYEILAVHVDLGFDGAAQNTLKKYLEEHGYPHQLIKTHVLLNTSRADVTCFWCSWNRRKVLFKAAETYRCNKIALGHHKDDIVQTILMNLLFEGEISAMVPYQEMFKGKIAIIRPLAYVEESDIEKFADVNKFPVTECLCPQARTTQRAVVKKFINEMQVIAPSVKTNIFKSLQRIKKDYLL